MTPRTPLAAAALALLAACQAGQVEAPGRADLGREIVRLDRPGPPDAAPGECWAAEQTPAVIETVTEHVQATPEVRNAEGQVVTPAAFRTVTRQMIVRDRAEVWFRAPCAADLTVTFVATLQRAMKARGLYLAPVTGVMDAATAEAVRRYQAPRGLDSATLSLAAARELGIVATSF